MKFLPLLDLRITHDYYADGRCPDFQLDPTPDTRRCLNNHRAVAKLLPDGMQILIAAANDDAPFIPLQPGMVLAFVLRLANPDFMLFTDTTPTVQTRNPTYTNAAPEAEDTQLALVAKDIITTERFIIEQPAPDARYVLGGRPLDGLQALDFTVESTIDGLNTVSHYDPGAKIITVNTQAASAGDSFAVTYVAAAAPQPDIFAGVEIHYGPAFPDIADGPARFEIAFTAKHARWQYYLLTDKQNGQFRIRDDDADHPVVFSAANVTNLTQHPDPGDRVAQTLTERYPTLQCLRFTSDDPVICQQRARKSLNLLWQNQVVVKTLPNPALHNYGTVTTEDSRTLDTLFRIVKYLTTN